MRLSLDLISAGNGVIRRPWLTAARTQFLGAEGSSSQVLRVAVVLGTGGLRSSRLGVVEKGGLSDKASLGLEVFRLMVV